MSHGRLGRLRENRDNILKQIADVGGILAALPIVVEICKMVVDTVHDTVLDVRVARPLAGIIKQDESDICCNETVGDYVLIGLASNPQPFGMSIDLLCFRIKCCLAQICSNFPNPDLEQYISKLPLQLRPDLTAESVVPHLGVSYINAVRALTLMEQLKGECKEYLNIHLPMKLVGLQKEIEKEERGRLGGLVPFGSPRELAEAEEKRAEEKERIRV